MAAAIADSSEVEAVCASMIRSVVVVLADVGAARATVGGSGIVTCRWLSRAARSAFCSPASSRRGGFLLLFRLLAVVASACSPVTMFVSCWMAAAIAVVSIVALLSLVFGVVVSGRSGWLLCLMRRWLLDVCCCCVSPLGRRLGFSLRR